MSDVTSAGRYPSVTKVEETIGTDLPEQESEGCQGCNRISLQRHAQLEDGNGSDAAPDIGIHGPPVKSLPLFPRPQWLWTTRTVLTIGMVMRLNRQVGPCLDPTWSAGRLHPVTCQKPFMPRP